MSHYRRAIVPGGVKMLVSSVYEIPILMSLIVIIGVMATSVVASIVFPKEEAQ